MSCAIAILVLLVPPATRADAHPSPWRVAATLRARQEVRLRSGERTRPLLTVECTGIRTRLSLDLRARRLAAATAAVPISGRLVVFEVAGDTVRQRPVDAVVWPTGDGSGRYGIPVTSGWARTLGVASEVLFLPDSVGPLTEQVAFDVPKVGPWRDAFVNCGGEKTADEPASSNDTGLPAYGEYVGMDEFPEAISKVLPRYPADFRGEGTVVVQALVNKEGRVVDTKIAKSNPVFDAAAEEAVRQYRFKPARSKGQPVAVWIAVPIRFVAD